MKALEWSSWLGAGGVGKLGAWQSSKISPKVVQNEAEMGPDYLPKGSLEAVWAALGRRGRFWIVFLVPFWIPKIGRI